MSARYCASCKEVLGASPECHCCAAYRFGGKDASQGLKMKLRKSESSDADARLQYSRLREELLALAQTHDTSSYVAEALALREVVDNLIAAAKEARESFMAHGRQCQVTGQGIAAAKNFEAAAKLFAAIEKASEVRRG